MAQPTGSATTASSAAADIVTVPVSALGRRLGFLLTARETALPEAIRAGFDLD